MIPVASPALGQLEEELILDCVRTGWISSKGRYVGEFEEKFAEFCGSAYAVATSNGTTALHLALLALELGPGDEVIVPSLTFAASANAVLYVGATPIFVDVDEATWCVDPEAVRRAITPRTKAIMPVHLYGHPANMSELSLIAQEHGLRLVEDAAEAHGATVNGRRVGALGDVAAFSFFANKIFTTGEGGAVTTDDERLAQRMRQLRDHGMDPNRRYWHPIIGYNYRLTNIQAAIGVAQLSRAAEILERKQLVADRYTSNLRDVLGVVLPPEAEWAKSVYWMFSILLDTQDARDRVVSHLAKCSIETRPFFYPLHWMPPYKTSQVLPVTDYLAVRGINLPSSVVLTNDEIDAVCQAVIEALSTSQG